MSTRHISRSPRLPKSWKQSVRSAVLHVISLSHYAIAQGRGRAANSGLARVRVQAEKERLRQKVLLLEEQIRIKDARMAQIAAQQRPHYRPAERMAILELRATQGWTLAQTARVFLVTSLTIAEWLRRVDEQGPQALVELSEPVNKFPDFVGYLVRRLRALCPTLGKAKIAETLARAGLHLGTTTVARMLQAPPRFEPMPTDKPGKRRVVTAKRPDHVWHVDLTVVPITSGFWTTWIPCALPQCWPFCWWVAVAVDHFSRRVMGLATFSSQPTSAAVRAFLGRTIRNAQATPKYLICDRGGQFDCHGFRRWCRRHGIRPRYGAIGRHGSIAVVERFIRTLKEGCRRLALVLLRRDKFQRELSIFLDWYNEHRPHETLGGQTPNEIYHHRFPAHRRPRHEPRSAWPRGSPCAKPWVLTRGRPGARLELHVEFLAGRGHLPVVSLKRVA